MKKFLCVLLAAILLVPAAYAETIDLSSMTYDELIELRARIAEEIVTRPEWNEFKLPAGTYIIGQDFPAGFYSVEYKNTHNYCSIYVWENDANRAADKTSFAAELSSFNDRTEIGKMELKEGNILKTTGELIFSSPKYFTIDGKEEEKEQTIPYVEGSFTASVGSYIVGEDIPAGKYSIHPIWGSFDYINYTILDEDGIIVLGGFLTKEGNDYIGNIRLKDGYTCTFEENSVRFVPSTGGIVYE